MTRRIVLARNGRSYIRTPSTTAAGEVPGNEGTLTEVLLHAVTVKVQADGSFRKSFSPEKRSKPSMNEWRRCGSVQSSRKRVFWLALKIEIRALIG